MSIYIEILLIVLLIGSLVSFFIGVVQDARSSLKDLEKRRNDFIEKQKEIDKLRKFYEKHKTPLST